ncbi:hypothetical protein BPOR_1551g00010 [Botrytis porri]|uniref:Cytochrome P450 n=1 Tax=Botrytis porri TaxID=87229 RepID=A0A4Z1K9U2_9HELO|nr:hypothetical protein BPOR_1551g00010 [Botrytis porri]
MLDEESSSLKEGKSFRGSSERGNRFVSTDSTITSKGLTVDETFGNIFVINFAGHDTTANILAFSMVLLAAHSEIQDWVAEELRDVTQDSVDEGREYEKVFEKLNRCRAVLFPPIMALPKGSNDNPQVLRVEDRTIVIPPRTGVMPSILGLEMHPKYWDDPLIWNSSRWIESSSDLSSQTILLGTEKIITPAGSTFFPRSDGPQNCPGQKFSQVEFATVLTVLLRDHKVSVVQNDNESPWKAQERALAVTQNCNLELLLRMRDADQVRLIWKKA